MALGSTQLLIEMSTRNISWGKSSRCVGLTNLPPSCADCLEIWEPQPPGTQRACPGLQWDCFTFLLPVGSHNTSVQNGTDDQDMKFDSQETLSMASSATCSFSPAKGTMSFNKDDSPQTDLHSNSGMVPFLTYLHNQSWDTGYNSWTVSQTSLEKRMKELLYPMLPDFCNSTAFWKVPRRRPTALLVSATCGWRRMEWH